MREHGERIAILETDSRNQKDTLDEMVDELKALNLQVTAINNKLASNMGFVAGVAFVFSMLGALLGLFGGAIFKKMGGA